MVSYIGETKRHLGIRASEHFNITRYTPTAVGSHIQECDECRNSLSNGTLTYRDFEVLKVGHTKFQIEVAESILVKRHNPSLNKQLFKSGCSYTCKIFV